MVVVIINILNHSEIRQIITSEDAAGKIAILTRAPDQSTNNKEKYLISIIYTKSHG